MLGGYSDRGLGSGFRGVGLKGKGARGIESRVLE